MFKTGVFIIAEAGVNHNGDLISAEKMVKAASIAGANAIKFQTFTAENLVIKTAPKADYQLSTTSHDESQFEMIKKLELDADSHHKIIQCCKENNIIFMSSPFDNDSIDLLNELKIEIFKVPSGEIINIPYLRKLGALNKTVLLSTGMASMIEIETALKELTHAGTCKENIIVLHCNTEYPTPYEDVNLNAMLTIKEAFNVKVGYSDHTPGIEVPIAAVTLGAVVIEKHFTLDKSLAGPDHKASLTPDELKIMVDSIRNIEKALGDGVKMPSKSEIKNMVMARKSIRAKNAIKKGDILNEENLTLKRPGDGISPLKWDEIIGRSATKDFIKDEAIEI